MGNHSLRLNPARAALATLALTALPMASHAFVSVGVSVNIAPPALPVYVQPACPGVGYIWTPGYWAWADDDYYWVPGTWVLAPSPGLLWTPGYWGWSSGAYLWHAGYWGPHVGFYGGINYGFGYTGVGFVGGYWHGGAFYYNRAYNNLGGIHVTNVYNRTVVNNITVNRVSFNGGVGGISARPTSHELAAEHDRHVAFTSVQREHEHLAFGDHDLRASVNGGKPRIAATARPAVFTGRGVIGAREAGAPYHATADHRVAERAEQGHGGSGRGPDLHPVDHGSPSHWGADRPSHSEAIARNDRPPGATGGSAAPRGGSGAIHEGPGAGRGTEFHSGGSAHNEGPAHSGGLTHNEGQAHGGELSHESPRTTMARGDRPSGAGGVPRPQGMPHLQNEARPQGMPHVQSEARPQQPMPHMQSESRPQGMQHMQSEPRPQAVPRMQSEPHPQGSARPEMRRGGGEQPHGQGGPQPRGGSHDQNHGRR